MDPQFLASLNMGDMLGGGSTAGAEEEEAAEDAEEAAQRERELHGLLSSAFDDLSSISDDDESEGGSHHHHPHHHHHNLRDYDVEQGRDACLSDMYDVTHDDGDNGGIRSGGPMLGAFGGGSANHWPHLNTDIITTPESYGPLGSRAKIKELSPIYEDTEHESFSPVKPPRNGQYEQCHINSAAHAPNPQSQDGHHSSEVSELEDDDDEEAGQSENGHSEAADSDPPLRADPIQLHNGFTSPFSHEDTESGATPSPVSCDDDQNDHYQTPRADLHHDHDHHGHESDFNTHKNPDYFSVLEDNKGLAAEVNLLRNRLTTAEGDLQGALYKLKLSHQTAEGLQADRDRLLGRISALEMEIKSERDSKHEYMRRHSVAEATIDSLQTQMQELGRSDCVQRAMANHEAIVTDLRERHEAALKSLQDELSAARDERGHQQKEILSLRSKMEAKAKESEFFRAERDVLSYQLSKSREDVTRLMASKNLNSPVGRDPRLTTPKRPDDHDHDKSAAATPQVHSGHTSGQSIMRRRNSLADIDTQTTPPATPMTSAAAAVVGTSCRKTTWNDETVQELIRSAKRSFQHEAEERFARLLEEKLLSQKSTFEGNMVAKFDRAKQRWRAELSRRVAGLTQRMQDFMEGRPTGPPEVQHNNSAAAAAAAAVSASSSSQSHRRSSSGLAADAEENSLMAPLDDVWEQFVLACHQQQAAIAARVESIRQRTAEMNEAEERLRAALNESKLNHSDLDSTERFVLEEMKAELEQVTEAAGELKGKLTKYKRHYHILTKKYTDDLARKETDHEKAVARLRDEIAHLESDLAAGQRAAQPAAGTTATAAAAAAAATTDPVPNLAILEQLNEGFVEGLKQLKDHIDVYMQESNKKSLQRIASTLISYHELISRKILERERKLKGKLSADLKCRTRTGTGNGNGDNSLEDGDDDDGNASPASSLCHSSIASDLIASFVDFPRNPPFSERTLQNILDSQK